MSYYTDKFIPNAKKQILLVAVLEWHDENIKFAAADRRIITGNILQHIIVHGPVKVRIR
jgi:hypothetical protein